MLQLKHNLKNNYLNLRVVQPWYPTLTRLSTVADLRLSFLDETIKILKPLFLISWKRSNV